MKTIKIVSFILMCFNFSFANAIVKEDSLKSRFEINDSRNPNCPCHKYQKLADEEYKKLLARESKLKEENTTTICTKTSSGNAEINSKNETVNRKIHFKQKRWIFFNQTKKQTVKKKKVRRLRRDNASCFHF